MTWVKSRCVITPPTTAKQVVASQNSSVRSMTEAPGIVAAQRTAQDDLSATHAFPVPFIPSKGHSQITFTRLTAKVTIRIYTIAGELVKTIVKDSGSSDEVSWVPVVNEAGRPVASGVYLYHVDSTDGKSYIGKIMVIK